MKKILLTLALGLTVFSCKKKSDCELIDMGSVTISNPYPTDINLTMNGESSYLKKESLTEIKLKSGSYVVSAYGEDDPTVSYSGVHEVKQCESTWISLY